MRLANNKLGLFVSRGIGHFPKYIGTVHRLYDATDGKVLYEFRDPSYPGGAPLAVDLTGDGIDEPIFFSIQYPAGQGAKAYVLHIPSHRLIAHDFNANFWSTPAIADIRGKGSLEMIGLTWLAGNQGTNGRPDLTWKLLRLDLSAKPPASRTWAGYMGTSNDGEYHPAVARP